MESERTRVVVELKLQILSWNIDGSQSAYSLVADWVAESLERIALLQEVGGKPSAKGPGPSFTRFAALAAKNGKCRLSALSPHGVAILSSPPLPLAKVNTPNRRLACARLGGAKMINGGLGICGVHSESPAGSNQVDIATTISGLREEISRLFPFGPLVVGGDFQNEPWDIELSAKSG
jgi:hypothetical protein